MMKSIVKDVLAREEQKSTQPVGQEDLPQPVEAVAPVAQSGPVSRMAQGAVAPMPMPIPTPRVVNEDEELRRVLAGLKTNIKIAGCGGAGCNTINRIVEEGIAGADLFALNSDAQHLLTIHAPHKILIGRRATRGLGAGAIPQVGEEAAIEAEEELRSTLQGTDILFVTCGLGGGTGTGSAPVVARIGREMGSLVISIVTEPFSAEGIVRMQNAEYGLDRLQEASDTVIVIPNDKLLEVVPRLALNAAFKVADEILMRSIKGITEIITKVGLVNLDFADLKTIMKGGGVAMIGLGESDSEDRSKEAVNEALNSPLLEVDISNATGALINVTGGEDMTVTEAENAAATIQERINSQAKIIWGAQIDPQLEHTMRVMLVVTGVKSKQIVGRTTGSRAGSSFGVDFIR